jgi:hypothetical protein
MVGEEILVKRSDIPEEELESVICRYLGLPRPDPQKKGIPGRFLNR